MQKAAPGAWILDYPNKTFEQLIVQAHPALENYLDILAYHLKDDGFIFLCNPNSIPLPYPILGLDLMTNPVPVSSKQILFDLEDNYIPLLERRILN